MLVRKSAPTATPKSQAKEFLTANKKMESRWKASRTREKKGVKHVPSNQPSQKPS